MQYKKKTAFTIIEVMFAMVIIGAIAIFTIPSILNYSQATKIKTALKKGCNTLVSAVRIEISTNTNIITPDDTSRLMDIISNKMNIKYYLNCSENSCTPVYDNPQAGYWAINEDNIGYRIEQGNTNCAPAVTINTLNSTQTAAEATCMSIIIDSDCIAKTRNPSNCTEIPDDRQEISSNSFDGSQMRVFMSKDGITYGNEENMAAGIIMAE